VVYKKARLAKEPLLPTRPAANVRFEAVPGLSVGDRVHLSGGYQMDPEWLSGKHHVEGVVVKWIPGQNTEPACVVHLNEAIRASGSIPEPKTITGEYVVLELRYVGHTWSDEGTVHVELCDFLPPDVPWQDREVGAWIESHARYAKVTS
jgi:hypothetical protein